MTNTPDAPRLQAVTQDPEVVKKWVEQFIDQNISINLGARERLQMPEGEDKEKFIAIMEQTGNLLQDHRDGLKQFCCEQISVPAQVQGVHMVTHMLLAGWVAGYEACRQDGRKVDDILKPPGTPENVVFGNAVKNLVQGSTPPSKEAPTETDKGDPS